MFPEDIKKWFASRGITEKTIKEFGFWWNGNHIVIPIKDEKEKTLFNKYRRDPRINDGPKYTYDKGAKITLFNYKPEHKQIIITEGELDAALLSQMGYNAVSSTGGSSSWQSDWGELFKDKEVFICYDNDEAGAKGAIKVAANIPNARIISFPDYWMGKDVTDFFQHHKKEQFDKLMDYAFCLPEIVDNNIKRTINICLEIRKTIRLKRINNIVIEQYINQLGATRQSQKKKEVVKNIQNIKEIPITNFLDFNMAGFRKCIWHKERSASLKYYPDTNTCYCFGCGVYADVIAVVQKQELLDFQDAIKYLKERYDISGN